MWPLQELNSSVPHMHPTLMADCIASATTQKLPEEPSAVAGTSCAPRSWHRRLAELLFAVLVAAPSTAFASQATLFMGCLQTAGHLETCNCAAKRTGKLCEKQAEERDFTAALAFICSNGEDTATVCMGQKGCPGQLVHRAETPEIEEKAFPSSDCVCRNG